MGECMIAQKYRYNLIPENFNLIIHTLSADLDRLADTLPTVK